MENRPRYRVPDELRETLLDFTIAYLLERPGNLAEFGLNFFQRLSGGEGEGRAPGGGVGEVNGGNGGADENDGMQKISYFLFSLHRLCNSRLHSFTDFAHINSC